ncbi:unnamed protein product [Adineta ricciae]|uniref:Apple domain-containing protein n=1 Tax=Adineta ricciae TaxID=249248 RepID=A0A814T394_ADIRI|nr:unnamed protein product [Adineta ricciae]CAF1653730.1 unnamed protein product [Adineta ricciae]
MSSYIDFHPDGTDFIPANSAEIRGNHSSVVSAFSCVLLCHQDPQCRTFVFDSSICQLYEGSSDTGLIVTSPSTNRLVGSINYDLVQLANTYNKSCDHCFPDRYLVYRNITCQCPLNSFYNGQGKCLNELYPDSSMICEDDKWCRQTMRIVQMPVISGTLPSKFSYVDESFNASGVEWWRAFDGNIYTYWNRLGSYQVLDYIFITFNDSYLLNSLQLTVYGDGAHDPKIINIYLDENGTCLAQSFWFPQTNNFTTFPLNYFNTSVKPLATKHALLSIERWSVYQAYLFELTFFGGLY